MKMMKIQKAYNTLTDPVARQNWREYGHPDGPQSFRLGIALPEWFLTQNARAKPLVLAVLLLGGIVGPMLGMVLLLRKLTDKGGATAGGERDTRESYGEPWGGRRRKGGRGGGGEG